MEVTSHVRQLDRRRICLHDIVRFPMGHKCIKIYTRHSFCSNIQIQAGRSCLNMKSSWNPQRRRVERPYSEPQKATVVLSTTTCGEAVKQTGWYAHQVIIFVWRLVSAAHKATINPPQSWQEMTTQMWEARPLSLHSAEGRGPYYNWITVAKCNRVLELNSSSLGVYTYFINYLFKLDFELMNLRVLRDSIPFRTVSITYFKISHCIPVVHTDKYVGGY